MSETTNKVHLLELLYSGYTEQNTLGLKYVAESAMLNSFDSIAALLATLDIERMPEASAVGLAMVLFHKQANIPGYWSYVEKVASKDYTLPELIWEGLRNEIRRVFESLENNVAHDTE